jgi:hypothetical protein
MTDLLPVRVIAPGIVFSWLAVTLPAGGCTAEDVANSEDPIRALSASSPSTRYGESYWRQQLAQDSDVWRQAIAYCKSGDAYRDYGKHPNCTLVGELHKGDQLLRNTRNRPRDSYEHFDGSRRPHSDTVPDPNAEVRR